jgi:PAS domain S-box-containing protein
MLGAVWQSGKSRCVPDIRLDDRLLQPDFAYEAGLRASLMVPVLSPSGIKGVLSFASYEIREPDARLLGTAESIGSQLGHYFARIENENALRLSEARLRSLLELSTDWYWEQDEEYRFVSFSGSSAEKTWGGRLDPMLGLRRWEIPGVNPVTAAWQAHRELVEARKPFRGFEYELTLGDLGPLCVAANGEPIFDANGRFKGYRGTATDVTARKRAEECCGAFASPWTTPRT